MKKIMKIAIVAIVAAVAGYGIYEAQIGNAMSEFALANVEALAAGESGFDCHIDWNYSQYCNYYANGPLCPCGF